VRLQIKEVAREKHISMRQLHLRSEIALSRIKRLYREPYTEVKIGTLARIADVLDCSISELFEEEFEQEESLEHP
jgi:DNA-binding Xre family transcriptional regulator